MREKAEGRYYLVCRNVVVFGHRTSMRLEPEVWQAMGDICRRERCSVLGAIGLFDELLKVHKRKRRQKGLP